MAGQNQLQDPWAGVATPVQNTKENADPWAGVATKQQPDRVADSLQNATISPPESGFAASIDRFKNKVRDWMGADHKPAGDVLGGLALGPLNMAHGAAISPDHPARGAHEIFSGLGQTAALPLAVANPGMMAYAAPGMVAQQGVSSGLKAVGVDPDYANLAGDAAAIVTGIGANSPKVMGTVKALARPFAKTAWEAAKDTPILGGAIKGVATFKDVPSEIRSVWTGKTGDPQLDLFNSTPKLGNSPINTSFNAPSPIVQGRTDPFVPSQSPMPIEVASPKSSFSSSNTTSTPVASPLKATTPKSAQTEVLRNMGIAAPSATVKPMTRVPTAAITPRPDLSFAGSNSGESAAMNQLSENFSPDRLGINDLRGIAQARGIKVAPADNHSVIIGKIHESLTPEELDRFDQAREERMQPDYSIPATIAPPQ
jgi:hypothetical protein